MVFGQYVHYEDMCVIFFKSFPQGMQCQKEEANNGLYRELM